MSALDCLLGPPPNELDAATGTVLVRTLLLPDDVQVHLQENQTDEEIVLFSIPGRVVADWLENRSQPWTSRCSHPVHPQAASVLVVDPPTGEVTLVEVWPRAALDLPTLGRCLADHRQTHLAWRALLRPSRSEQHAPTQQTDNDPARTIEGYAL
jgi:hypothetical protein